MSLKSNSVVLAALGAALCSAMVASPAMADESGVSFWLPGQYGSFAAIAPDPGFSLPTISYYYSGEMSAERTLRQGSEIAAGVDATFLAQFIVPTFTSEKLLFGATPSVSLAILPAYSEASANVSVGQVSASRTDSVSGFGDLYPTAQLFWNKGKNNWMAYVTAGIPVGSYQSDRLANLGTGHAALDVGGAYTYLDPETGWEFSATAGVTFNFENQETDYTSGTDLHLDVGTAKFLSEQFFIGAVGFAYFQVTSDEGRTSVLGDFKSQALGAGPQFGYNFMAGDVPVYTNLRGYLELETENRPQGASLFLTVNLPVSKLSGAR